MPATITRATWTDDDGSGTVGTLINNARLQADLYDKIDALALVLGGADPVAFTPTAVGATSGSAAGSGAGTYIKINKLVLVNCYFSFTGVGTLVGQVMIGNLPYANVATARAMFYIGEITSLVSAVAMVTANLAVSDTKVGLFKIPAAGATSQSALTNADIQNGTVIRLAGFYFTP